MCDIVCACARACIRACVHVCVCLCVRVGAGHIKCKKLCGWAVLPLALGSLFGQMLGCDFDGGWILIYSLDGRSLRMEVKEKNDLIAHLMKKSGLHMYLHIPSCSKVC